MAQCGRKGGVCDQSLLEKMWDKLWVCPSLFRIVSAKLLTNDVNDLNDLLEDNRRGERIVCIFVTVANGFLMNVEAKVLGRRFNSRDNVIYSCFKNN